MSYEDRVTITVDEIDILLEGLPHDLSYFFWGGTGLGKTSAIKQFTQKHNMGYKPLSLANTDPTDIRGLPWVDKENNLARWATPAMLPHKNIDAKIGILFLDELPNAHPSIQSGALELTLEGRVGEYVLPEGWRVIAGGNRLEDMAGAHQMIRSLNNRFIHFEVVADKRVWVNWALEHNVHPDVIGFISSNPEALAPECKTTADKQKREWATPRTWEFCSKVLQSPLNTMSPKLTQKSIIGAVGAGWARQFLTFVELKDKLPDNDAIFLHGEKLPLPTEISYQFAYYSSLCAYIDTRAQDDPKLKTDKVFMDGLCYIITDLQNPEFKELILKHLSARHKDLVTGLMMNPKTAATIARMFSELGLTTIFTTKRETKMKYDSLLSDIEEQRLSIGKNKTTSVLLKKASDAIKELRDELILLGQIKYFSEDVD